MSPSCTILILEDNPDFLELVMMSLEELAGGGIRMIGVSDSAEAVRVLETTPVDLVITDYHQPPGNAEPLLRFVAENGGLSRLRFSQVICMSSHTHAVGGFKTAVQAGATFLSKGDSQFTSKIVAQARMRLDAPAILSEAA
jgi:CheY-like chemotaxis protein